MAASPMVTDVSHLITFTYEASHYSGWNYHHPGVSSERFLRHMSKVRDEPPEPLELASWIERFILDSNFVLTLGYPSHHTLALKGGAWHKAYDEHYDFDYFYRKIHPPSHFNLEALGMSPPSFPSAPDCSYDQLDTADPAGDDPDVSPNIRFQTTASNQSPKIHHRLKLYVSQDRMDSDPELPAKLLLYTHLVSQRLSKALTPLRECDYTALVESDGASLTLNIEGPASHKRFKSLFTAINEAGFSDPSLLPLTEQSLRSELQRLSAHLKYLDTASHTEGEGDEEAHSFQSILTWLQSYLLTHRYSLSVTQTHTGW
eukprot:Blabericola_migrator_1__6172@NODE_3114_length_2027_cov_4_517347_g1951_i0_p1_GENE_NODE_3114_length_2027_cov_4_517347_g1951_i0NODE_3114_length_2027_cov_4_517347_g1951_i0_p1_ORF_typecomplete_len360_score82_84Peptidase_M16_M/PF16187_5/0_00052_NODE_3114_length_2027_cov_4_517347_g1951_i01341081